MRLKTLEIQGFKSFADKTQINIKDGITAVVGPNGSGKSNISDAIRWVLGEQSAKNLRGGKMGDVIFAGTQDRKPVGFCQVALTFDNEDNWLPLDFLEVTISRRYYKSGESEYYINKTPCRLKDLLELFRDTGVGKEGYSIIGQGQITNILSSNSDDRRMAFEAATGVLKYKTRKAEATKRLDQTNLNILRIADVLLEMENQLGVLKEESKIARNYEVLRDELKSLEITKFCKTYEMQNAKQLKLSTDLDNIIVEIETLKNNRVINSEKRTNLNQENIKFNEKLEDLKNKRDALQMQLMDFKSQQQIFDERVLNYNKDVLTFSEQIERTKDEIANLDLNKSQSQIQQTNLKTELETSKNSYEIENKKCIEFEKDLKAKNEYIENLKQKKMAHLNSVSEVKVNFSRLSTMLDSLETRMKFLTTEKEVVKKARLELDTEQKELTIKVQNLESQIDEINKEKEKLNLNKQELVLEFDTAKKEKQNLEILNSSLQSKHQLLQNMQKEYEGYNFSVKNLLKATNHNADIKQKILGVVADVLDVESKYVKAIECAVGGALQNIITKNEQDAKYLIGFLKDNNLGRVTFLPISAMKSRKLNAMEQKTLDVPGVFGVASQLVTFDNLFEPVVSKLLGRVVIVENLDVAIKLMKNNNYSFTTVTLDGDIMSPSGSMSGGSKMGNSTSIISRSDQINKLAHDIEKNKTKIADYVTKFSSFEDMVLDFDSKIEKLKLNAKSIYESLDVERDILSATKAQIDNNELDLQKINLEYDQIKDNFDDVSSQISNLDQSNTMETKDTSEQEFSVLFGERDKIAENLQECQKISTELLVNIAKHEQQLNSVSMDISRIEKDISYKNRQIEDANNKKISLEKDIATINLDISREELDKINEEIQEFNLKIEEIAKQTNATKILLQEIEDNQTKIEETLQDNMDRKYTVSVDKEKCTIEIENIVQDMLDRYELDYETAKTMDTGAPNTGSNMRIRSIKEQIKNMGNINMNSIEAFAEMNGRFVELEKQKDDLLASKKDLEELIAMLFETMETKFAKSFKLINENFQKTFIALFGGGKAELILKDENNVMECDIEIIAQPPGKKLQNISLMSGGEKALTAIAILFAMLKLKPTPFCVLDEIEAALDEANVVNFAEYLKNYSENTQFIVITHRRGVMDNCNALYGIAMQEKGVSKVVSIKMDQDQEA